jgi:CelD/BcsL family acetyltransferase involved in cellulose biosynthesis
MQVTVVPASALASEHVRRWASLQESDPALSSPFFRPEFSQVVAQVRDDAFVGVLEGEREAAGFFPFQRVRLGLGVPMGGERSNYQGVIADRDLEWQAEELVRACGLRIWDFHHVISDQPQFASHCARMDDSPVMDLTRGFDGYAERRGRNGSRVVKRLRQQARRIEREIGPLHFEPHASDHAALRRMMRWKSEQYRATRSQDRFAIPWNVELLERIHAWQTDGFAGMLPVLYAAERIVAVAMCLRSFGTVHYWFPAYDRELASYSPGLLLMLRLAESAESLGVTTIDLGKGRTPYKDRLATGAVQVGEGSVAVPSLRTAMRRMRVAGEEAVRGSALAPSVRRLRRALRRPN